MWHPARQLSRESWPRAATTGPSQVLYPGERGCAVTVEPVGFRDFVVARSPRFLHTAYLLTGDAHLAKDLVQTSLARTWPQWDRIRDGNPDAYVKTVMVRLATSWWRRKWRGEVPTEVLPEPRSGVAGSGDTTAGMPSATAWATTSPRSVSQRGAMSSDRI